MIANPSTPLKARDHKTQSNLAVLNGFGSSPENQPIQPLSPEGQLKVHSAPFRGSFPGVLSEALRAAGLGSQVMVAQLLKGGVAQGPKGIISLCGRLEWIRPAIAYCINENEADQQNDVVGDCIKEVWEICKDRLLNGDLDQLVLDEIGLAISLGYLKESELIATLEKRPHATDVILTGPSIPSTVMTMADQVTVLRSGT